MRSIVLKIDVDTYRGTREGVPRLVHLLQKHHLPATFLFSLGPDHTGWALKRIFRPGFFQKVQRTSVVSHYGVKTLMYGVLLPAPLIGRKCAAELRAVKNAGFEVGVHTYDHVYWQDNVRFKSREWTENQLRLAEATFRDIFGEDPRTHGAAGWQMNKYAYSYLKKISYASDSRGREPFFPLFNGEKSECLQMPTTLPTMDEMLGDNGINENNIAEHLLNLTKPETQYGHVFTLHAELEGMKLLKAFESFILGLKAQSYNFFSMSEYYQQLDLTKLPACEVDFKTIPGRTGEVSCQC